MRSDEEIIKIFKEKMKFDIGCTFAGMLALMLGVFAIITHSVLDGLIIVFIAIILFCSIALIYELYVRFYNLNALKKGDYFIHINPTVDSVDSGSRDDLHIRVKDCDEDFDITSDNIENFSHNVYCVTTKKGTYPVCFYKEDC